MKNIITLILCAMTQIAMSQAPTGGLNQYDSHFPLKGRFNAGVLTTYSTRNPPPILLGDISYGVSNKFSVGVVGGTVGVLALYGVKLNAMLFQRDNFRVAFKMMSVYYPERNGTFLFDRTNKHIMPWMLSTGVVDAEWKMENNIRWSLGMGLTETHCYDGMKRFFTSLIGQEPSGAEAEDKFDVLTTINGSVSIPVSKRLTFRPEAFAVFQNGQLIKRGEHKVGFPIIASVTLVYSF